MDRYWMEQQLEAFGQPCIHVIQPGGFSAYIRIESLIGWQQCDESCGECFAMEGHHVSKLYNSLQQVVSYDTNDKRIVVIAFLESRVNPLLPLASELKVEFSAVTEPN